MGARYRYAADRDGRLIAIDTLRRDSRTTCAPFSCVGCGKELIPKLGEVVVHHFAHKFEQSCAGETYLHRLAKLAFIEKYQKCLTERRPFFLTWTRTLKCNHFHEQLGFRCAVPDEPTIDLTQHFDSAELERECDGFRADVLLQSSQTPSRRLFIEMAVTHWSSDEKKARQIPIIEVAIQDEDHAVTFAREGLDGSSPYVKLLNFKHPAPRDVCKGRCPTYVDVFLVHPGGKCVIASVTAESAMSSSYHPRALRKEIVQRSGSTADHPNIFVERVRKAYFDGIAVRNCYICRQYGIGTFEHPIFCLAFRAECESNEAATCREFRPFRSRDECVAADARNRLYIEKREAEWLKKSTARTRTRGSRQPRRSSESKQARDFIKWEQEWKRAHSGPPKALEE